MSKKVIIIAIVLIILGGVTYSLVSSNDKAELENMRAKNGADNQTSNSSNSTQSNTVTGSYIEYSPSVIAETTGTKLLFFHAAWCPQCRSLEADIKKQGVPSGVAIIKVDYDNSQSLRQKYGVTLQTTVVKVDDEGNLVEKYVAYDNPSLEALKENLLQ